MRATPFSSSSSLLRPLACLSLLVPLVRSENVTVQCTISSEGEVICNGTTYYSECEGESGPIPPSETLFWVYLFIALGLVLFAGLMSGLTVGLMSLDVTTLSVLSATSEDPKEKKYALRLIPLLRQQHFLLVTLLLSNAVAMEALPIFLDRISSAVVAIVISVTAVLFFGEVIPQALCKRYGLAIGANTVVIVRILMVCLAPISWPISKLLDWLLGTSHGTYYRRTQLKEFVKLHGVKNEDNEDPLNHNEIIIIRGVLDMREKKVHDIMTPLDRAYMVPDNAPLTEELLQVILDKGYSRIPVFDHTNPQSIHGALVVKKLVVRDYLNPSLVMSEPLAKVLQVDQNKPLFGLLNDFLMENLHMAMVYGDSKLIGIVTLEDVLEELIQEEIEDESLVDLERKIKSSHLLKKGAAGPGGASSSLEAEGDQAKLGKNLNLLANKIKRLASNERPLGPKLMDGESSDEEIDMIP